MWRGAAGRGGALCTSEWNGHAIHLGPRALIRRSGKGTRPPSPSSGVLLSLHRSDRRLAGRGSTMLINSFGQLAQAVKSSDLRGTTRMGTASMGTSGWAQSGWVKSGWAHSPNGCTPNDWSPRGCGCVGHAVPLADKISQKHPQCKHKTYPLKHVLMKIRFRRKVHF